MKKRGFACLLGTLMLMSLAACGGDDKSDKTEATTEATTAAATTEAATEATTEATEATEAETEEETTEAALTGELDVEGATVEALPALIDTLISEGYEIVPIDSKTTPVHHGESAAED